MKRLIIIIALAVPCLFSSCGESAKQKQEREAAEAQHRADSIAKVEAEKAELEQHRLDSIKSAEKRAARLAADSTVRAELLPEFSEELNADSSGASLYAVKSAPKGHRHNTAFLSFRVDNGTAREIFLNVGYFGNDWLYIKRASLLIDNDEPIDISMPNEVPSNVNSDATCSEWFTSELYSNTLEKLLDAKSISIKLFGDEKEKLIKLSPKQVADMQKTIRLYQAFGG
ncbi:MAG: hypothetical protein K2N48_11450 [Muribaculaceae bacterium]|nr:hypothetical protein [Muribaculaceae bacterium]